MDKPIPKVGKSSFIAEIDTYLRSLTWPEMAQLYDDMLERKILNGTIGDPMAYIISEYIIEFVGRMPMAQRLMFIHEHDKILFKQFGRSDTNDPQPV